MKLLIIIPPEKFNNNEFNTTIDIFNRNNIPFDISSTTESNAYGYLTKSNDGKKVPLSVRPDFSIIHTTVSKYIGIVIIGGSGNKKYLWDNSILHKIINDFFKQRKLICAICLAPICLIKAGIIKSGKITAFKTSETLNIIRNSGNEYISSNVYVYGNIITANEPKASKEFAEVIVKNIKEKEKIVPNI